MDYLDPVNALVSGVDGAVLSVLVHADAPLTLRQIAERAGASHPQVSHHVQRFEKLGLVQRHIVGRGHLVQLSQSAAAEWLRSLARLRDSVLEQMRVAATVIQPAPESIVVFGSFARGTATAESDIDVLIVAPPGAADSETWLAQVAAFTDRCAAVAGNPTAELIWPVEQLAQRQQQPLWTSIAAEGIVVVGQGLEELAAHVRVGHGS